MYKKILVAVDGSAGTAQVLQEAARMAPADASLRVVSVVENPMWGVPLEQGVLYDLEAMHNSLLKAATDILVSASEQLGKLGLQAETRVLDLFEADNSIPGAILREADAWGADVIVIGTHGRRGIKRLIMGSVAESLLRVARRPVLLVHGPVDAQ
ncbi:MAG: universal stress protein [Pseudomonadota bacterium]